MSGMVSVEQRVLGGINVVGALSRVLASAYFLCLKTHGCQRNLRGSNFLAFHTLFDSQYQEQWEALDAIAERTRILGGLALQSYAAFARLTTIESGDPGEDADVMAKELMQDHRTILTTLRDAVAIAETAGDQATMELCHLRTTAHEKHHDMLRGVLGIGCRNVRWNGTGRSSSSPLSRTPRA